MDNVPWKKFSLKNEFFTADVKKGLKECINNDQLYEDILYSITKMCYLQQHAHYLFFYKPPSDKFTLCYNLQSNNWIYQRNSLVETNFTKEDAFN